MSGFLLNIQFSTMTLECVTKYLEDDGSFHPEFSKTVMDEFPDEPAYRKCRATLNSSAKLETLVMYNFIKPSIMRQKKVLSIVFDQMIPYRIFLS